MFKDPGKAWGALQKHNSENSKHLFREKELRRYSTNSYIHISVRFSYSTTNVGTKSYPIVPLKRKLCK
jgi:hypothetical protein